MSDFAIEFEWLDPADAKGPELRATWARLSIFVADQPVIKVYDSRVEALRKAVYLPLYPLAEWLAGQWWTLWHEPSSRMFTARSGYDARHCLVGAREGYALPPLRIEQADSLVKLSWAEEPLPHHCLEFVGRGEEWIETDIVKRRLESFIDAVVTRLESNDITDTALQLDWHAVKSADKDEREFCECAGALGLDPYALNDKKQRMLGEVEKQLPQAILPEFFKSACYEELLHDTQAIRNAVTHAQSNTNDVPALKELRRIASAWRDEPVGSRPWSQGYIFAQKLRTHLGLNGTLLKSMDNTTQALGTTEADIIREMDLFPKRTAPFTAVMGSNEKSSPLFVLLKHRLPQSNLFRFCRAFFEYLYLPSLHPALITDSTTEQQKRNRAFAAEFLAPASVLRERVESPVVTEEQTEELASEFGVSGEIIKRQLENHRIAHVVVQDL